MKAVRYVNNVIKNEDVFYNMLHKLIYIGKNYEMKQILRKLYYAKYDVKREDN